MSLPAVMQHLAVLEGSGLVRSVKVGRVRTCRIEPRALCLAEQWINQRRAEWELHFDKLGTLPSMIASSANAKSFAGRKSVCRRLSTLIRSPPTAGSL